MNSARLFVHRFRRPLAAASAALCVLILAAMMRPPSPDLVDVIVAKADLPAGSTLAADDLEQRPMVAEYVVTGTVTDLGSAVGRTLAAGMDRGEMLTRSRLVSTDARADGLLTVPVRLADAEAAELLAPGVTIDLVLASGDPAGRTPGRIIAEGVRVVTVPRSSSPSGLGPTTRRAGSLIVVATDRRTAVALAAVGAQPGLGVVLR